MGAHQTAPARTVSPVPNFDYSSGSNLTIEDV
jgi:hypothetical protein